jgi:hypothetical protein
MVHAAPPPPPPVLKCWHAAADKKPTASASSYSAPNAEEIHCNSFQSANFEILLARFFRFFTTKMTATDVSSHWPIGAYRASSYHVYMLAVYEDPWIS